MTRPTFTLKVPTNQDIPLATPTLPQHNIPKLIPDSNMTSNVVLPHESLIQDLLNNHKGTDLCHDLADVLETHYRNVIDSENTNQVVLFSLDLFNAFVNACM